MSNPNVGIGFIPIPKQENAEASRKRLVGCVRWFTTFKTSNNRKGIIEYLLKLSVYEFQQDISKDFTPSGVADAVRQLAESGGTYGAGISAAARELLDRWNAGTMQPRLLRTALTAPSPAPAPAPAAPPPPPAPAANIIVYSRFHRNNVVFQTMMRGMTRAPRKSAQLVITARRSDRHGHNGLHIGAWWPLMATVRRDGAHALTQAGVYGNQSEGAFSIVACGGVGYDGVDNDQGNVLWYSGPLAPDGAMKPGSQYLAMNQTTCQPVRVIRGANGGGPWAPKVGYRYDGLYRVEDYGLVTKGNTEEEFWLFKLVRMQNQEQLDQVSARSPTPQQVAAYWDYRAL
jgi:hypothetical protein